MQLQDSIVLITGANRGLGKALAEAAVAGGARKVYGGARNAASINIAGVIPIQLDVTNAADIAAAVQAIPDLTVLVNNAGIAHVTEVTAPEAAHLAQQMFNTNFFGPLALSQAFAPTLKTNGGGAIINVLSAAVWMSIPGTSAYSASKAAAWALTNSLRLELKAQQTQVLGAHMGLMDTDMTTHLNAEKASTNDIAQAIYTALQNGESEVLADDSTREVKQGLNATPSLYLA